MPWRHGNQESYRYSGVLNDTILVEEDLNSTADETKTRKDDMNSMN